jgi:N-glycosylase/DNA lyase
MRMVHVTELELKPPPRFFFPLVVESHGWFALAPFSWDRRRAVLSTALLVADRPALIEIAGRKRTLAVKLACEGRATRALRDDAARKVREMLSLDEDLETLHAQASTRPDFAWIAERGAGRMLRSPTVFEDLVKVLCTTNCSWSLTELMVRRLIDEIGAPAPSGRRAFPTPAAMAAQDERFFRERVRMGYRARAAVELARAVESGALAPEEWRDPRYPRDEIERQVLTLRGFGPYAMGGLLRLLGHHEHLALDSWCRAQYARLHHRGRRVTDATIARRYEAFGSSRGIALWLDLTREWHEQGGAPETVARKNQLAKQSAS